MNAQPVLFTHLSNKSVMQQYLHYNNSLNKISASGLTSCSFSERILFISSTFSKSNLVRKGSKVSYSNPFDKDAEYWSVCIPAFSIEKVHRNDP